MKKSKRKPIKESSLLGFDNNHSKATKKSNDDLIKALIVLIEMDRQHKNQSSGD